MRYNILTSALFSSLLIIIFFPVCSLHDSTNGWSVPVNLGSPVNTDGWEDSVSISPDGNSLYFSYANYDFLTYLISGGTNRIARGPNRGLDDVDLGDIMVSYRTGDG